MTDKTEQTRCLVLLQNAPGSGTCCPLLQPDPQPVQSHRPVPVELPKGDGPRPVCRSQRERLRMFVTVDTQYEASADTDHCRSFTVCPQFPLGVTDHTLKWEGVWRELGCLARSTSFAVREESGHSLKSALSVPPELPGLH